MKDNKDKTRPVGMMDSGLGGISVLREAVRVLPQEDFIYYGDSKNVPYGTRTTEKVQELTFNVVEKLRQEYNIKAMVIACNTATSASIKALREHYTDMPIIGIEPALKPAVICSQGGRIIVMGTPMTMRLENYQRLMNMYKDEAEIVPLMCWGLAEYVEDGIKDHEGIKKYFDENLKPVLTEDTESIVLGCTHYPFLKKELRKYLGDKNINLIDGSRGTSSQLRRRLEEEGILRDEDHEGKVTFLNSSEDPRMIELSWQLLNMDLD